MLSPDTRGSQGNVESQRQLRRQLSPAKSTHSFPLPQRFHKTSSIRLVAAMLVPRAASTQIHLRMLEKGIHPLHCRTSPHLHVVLNHPSVLGDGHAGQMARKLVKVHRDEIL